MPLNGLSTGRDHTLTVIINGVPTRFRDLTAFRSRQDTTEQKITLMNGKTKHIRFFVGWSGSFTMERAGGQADAYFNQLESDYYLGLDETPVYLDSVIAEVNGGLSPFQYQEVLLKLDDAGEWSGNSNVKMQVSFLASRRIGL